MELFSITSGSSGNCICTGNANNHVMIDVGISGKKIEEGLNTYDFTTSDMDAILITHEHSDHIQGLGVISRKYHIPIYATAGTIRELRGPLGQKRLGQIDDTLFHVVRPDEEFQIGSLKIHPFRVSHDAADPVAYTVADDKAKVGVCTDLGYFDDYIVDNLAGSNLLLIESNHDVRMLQVGSYAYPLKQRILSDMGHLSNESGGQLVGKLLHDDVKHVFLGHLSQENNLPELAYETVKLEVTMGENPYKGTDFPIEVARRDMVSRRVECL